MQIQSPVYYYFAFFFIGIFTSPLFPSVIHLLGSWFAQGNRGFMLGLWATCSNIGNIMGVQLAAVLLKLFNNRWEFLQFSISVMMLLCSTMTYLFLNSYPEELNIEVVESESGFDGTNDPKLIDEQSDKNCIEMMSLSSTSNNRRGGNDIGGMGSEGLHHEIKGDIGGEYGTSSPNK